MQFVPRATDNIDRLFMSQPSTQLTSSHLLDLPKQPVSPQVQKLHQQGNEIAFKGDYAPAIEFYDRAIAADPNFAIAYYDRGEAWLRLKNYRQAEADFMTALKLRPTLIRPDGGLAKVYLGLGDCNAALSAGDRAIQRDPENLDFYHTRALINKKIGNFAAIIADCKFILERQPSDISARWMNSRAHFQAGNYQIAIFNFSQYLNLQPDDFYAYYYRGSCYERMHNFQRALTDLDRAIEIKGNRAILYRRRGRIHQQLGNFTNALEDYDRAIDLDPGMAQAYVNRADIYINRGDYPRAIVQCNQAIAIDPQLVDAHYQRGVINTEVGNLHAALADYHRLIQIDPQDTKAYIQRGWIYFRHGEYAAAMNDCEMVRSIDRESVAANYLLGVVQSLSGFKQEAIFSLTKTLESEPNFVCAFYHRGLLYHDLKNTEKAIQDFRLAQEIQNLSLENNSPRDETGLYAEGLALYHLGQTDTAKGILYQAALLAQKLKSTVFLKQIDFTMEALGMKEPT